MDMEKESNNGEIELKYQGMEKKEELASKGISQNGIINQTESSDGEKELNDWGINLSIKKTDGESGIGKKSGGENESKPGWEIGLSVDNTSGKSSGGTSLMAKVSISILLLAIPLMLF
jgi:hypothetical protein